MPSNSNTAIVSRFFDQVFAKGNLDYIDEIIASDYTFNGLPSSAERTKKWAKRKRHRYKNLRFQIEDLTGHGDFVSFRWTMQGIDSESFGELVARHGRTKLTFRAGQCISNIQTDEEVGYAPLMERE